MTSTGFFSSLFRPRPAKPASADLVDARVAAIRGDLHQAVEAHTAAADRLRDIGAQALDVVDEALREMRRADTRGRGSRAV